MWLAVCVGPGVTHESPREASDKINFGGFCICGLVAMHVEISQDDKSGYLITIANKVSVSSFMNRLVCDGL